MAKHSPRFETLVDESKQHIREVNVAEVNAKLGRNEDFYLVDVREESEWAAGHLPKAVHLGKGVIERDIEKAVADMQAQIVLYCGGGFRSALAAESLQKMGYRDVYSMDGGYRGWSEFGLPIERD